MQEKTVHNFLVNDSSRLRCSIFYVCLGEPRRSRTNNKIQTFVCHSKLRFAKANDKKNFQTKNLNTQTLIFVIYYLCFEFIWLLVLGYLNLKQHF
jgi:hypothetical protein